MHKIELSTDRYSATCSMRRNSAGLYVVGLYRNYNERAFFLLYDDSAGDFIDDRRMTAINKEGNAARKLAYDMANAIDSALSDEAENNFEE